MGGDIILLTGASSSGKSMLSTAIQRRAARPLLHLSSDLVGVGLPERRDESGPFRWWEGYRVAYFDGFQRSIAAYAEAGVDLVVDHVIEFPSWREQLRHLLRPFDVLLVGVHCDLDVLDRRERARGDRRIGEGRTHVEVDRIHAFGPYDLEVDTTGGAYDELAAAVLDAQARGPGRALGHAPSP